MIIDNPFIKVKNNTSFKTPNLYDVINNQQMMNYSYSKNLDIVKRKCDFAKNIKKYFNFNNNLTINNKSIISASNNNSKEFLSKKKSSDKISSYNYKSPYPNKMSTINYSQNTFLNFSSRREKNITKELSYINKNQEINYTPKQKILKIKQNNLDKKNENNLNYPIYNMYNNHSMKNILIKNIKYFDEINNFSRIIQNIQKTNKVHKNQKKLTLDKEVPNAQNEIIYDDNNLNADFHLHRLKFDFKNYIPSKFDRIMKNKLYNQIIVIFTKKYKNRKINYEANKGLKMKYNKVIKMKRINFSNKFINNYQNLSRNKNVDIIRDRDKSSINNQSTKKTLIPLSKSTIKNRKIIKNNNDIIGIL